MKAVASGRDVEQQGSEIGLLDQRRGFPQREPSQFALAAFRPVVEDPLDQEGKHLDPAAEHAAVPQQLGVGVPADPRPLDPAGDAGLFEGFPRRLPVR